eukprot:TRINITY_DN51183_c0_g1_i1.p1 TRINITY_DN51183_c0_g1~~TRINITY_DN51183_c0_g1_i1.p1  ORF type:complete len:365 (-),score=40.72 TRINITY_DN51183_c0_g1_i1:189-1163(-)
MSTTETPKALARPLIPQTPEVDAANALIARRRLKFRFMKHDSWENALFVHWPVDPAKVASMLPKGLEPDVVEDSAWVGLVLLTERGVSASSPFARRIVKPIDHYGANVRTYVQHNGVKGIFFFSLECTSVLASLGARLAGIPYFPARMWRKVDIERPLGVGGGKIGCYQVSSPPVKLGNQSQEQRKGNADGDDAVLEFSSERVGRFGGRSAGPSVTARWRVELGTSGKQEQVRELGRWFVERYSVYAAWPWGRGPILLRGDVQHKPWSLQPAALEELHAETLMAAAGFEGIGSLRNTGDTTSVEPHVCFSRGVGPIVFWMLEPA